MNTTSTQKVEGLQYEVCFCGNMIYKDSFSGEYLPFYLRYDFFNYETYLEYELEGIPYRFCGKGCIYDFLELLSKLDGAEDYHIKEGSRSGGRPAFAVLEYADRKTSDIKGVYLKHNDKIEQAKKDRENGILKACMNCGIQLEKDYLLLRTGNRICSTDCLEEIISEVAEFEMSKNNKIIEYDYGFKKGYSCIGIPLEININYYEAENFLCSKNY